MRAFEALAEITGTLENRYTKDWTEKGKKILGYVCSYVPEEIFYAADILPYRITGKGVSDTSRADCMLFTGHVACKQAWGAYRLVADEVKNQLGIPTIRLEADGWDSRITPMPVIKEKLSDFFDMVIENK